MRDAGGAGGSGFAVHPAALDQAGTASQQCGQQVRQDLPRVVQADTEAASGLPGWQTAQELERTSSAWSSRLRALAQELDTTGADLHRTAEAYRGTERDVHGSMAV
ncbi:hypothetical protein ACIQGZ_00465 [Streptomyces sp. NPDC092296]|uniref:hypothetical protein n=1 Tax=Streptomyces sp. NPDC092296 TaxID=3366012 RepID=UPI00382F21EC